MLYKVRVSSIHVIGRDKKSLNEFLVKACTTSISKVRGMKLCTRNRIIYKKEQGMEKLI